MLLRQKFQPFYKGVTSETFGFSFSFSNFLLEDDFVIVISKTTKQERGQKKKKKNLELMEQMHLHNMDQDMVSFIGDSIHATLVKFDFFKTSLHSSTLLLCIV